MTRDLMDLERIRRNWERGQMPVRDPSADRLADVKPPADPYLVGAELIERMKREAAADFPSRAEMLRPFLERTESLFLQMEKQAKPTSALEPTSAPDPAELRAAFMVALHDLEDLCEVFAGLGR